MTGSKSSGESYSKNLSDELLFSSEIEALQIKQMSEGELRSMSRPRAATALELLRICGELQTRFSEITLPLLIVHGSDDVVCDPECVRTLYEKAGSEDKTLKIHEGLWHQLVGESNEDVSKVFGEVCDWLCERADKARQSE